MTLFKPTAKPSGCAHGWSRRRALAIIAVWILALGVGFAILIDHDLQAGSSSTAASHWPADSSLARSADGPTLVMFIHPQCPCTAASLEQLAEIIGDQQAHSARTYILIADVADHHQGENVARARLIPNALVQHDSRDAEAKVFGSHTSGDLFIFAADGNLVFHGGITSARGHVGENPAAAAARAAASGQHGERIQMPVFGCPLTSEALESAG